jgi:hypothetical protein
MSPIEREAHPASPPLYSGDRPCSHNLVSRACMDDKEWESAASCKCLELSASVGNAVYFVVCIREKGDSCTYVLCHADAEWALPAICQSYETMVLPH